MTLLGFKTILHKKCSLAKIQRVQQKIPGPVSSKMKTNFKKSGSLFKNLLTYDALRDMKNHSVLEMIMGWSLQDYPTSTRLSIFFKSTSTSLFIGGTFY